MSLLTTIILPIALLSNITYIVDVPQILMDNAVQTFNLEAQSVFEPSGVCYQPDPATWCDRYNQHVLVPRECVAFKQSNTGLAGIVALPRYRNASDLMEQYDGSGLLAAAVAAGRAQP